MTRVILEPTDYETGNVVRAAVVNAGGAADFCARFLDRDDRPVTDIAINLAK